MIKYMKLLRKVVLDMLKYIDENTYHALEVNLSSELYITCVDDNWTTLKVIPNGAERPKYHK